MHLKLITSAILALLLSGLFAQAPIEYSISFANAVHHEAEISIEYDELDTDRLQLRMSIASPGRYAIHQFGKNVYNVRASAANKPLKIERIEAETWEIVDPPERLKVTYTLFADLTDGTYSEIDDIHTHLNMPATFMWAIGLEERPIELTFDLSGYPDWKIATQLQRTRDPLVYRAPDFQYFMDSPIMLCPFQERQWELSDDRSSARIRMIMHHEGSPEDLDAYAESAKKITAEHLAIFGELPAFENEEYLFLCDYREANDRDGMEHRNSTIITANQPIAGNESALLNTVSHEFFHAWNVERIRPASLEPFDFDAVNMSPELWFAEGFTNYYGYLVLHRAGIYELEDYCNRLTLVMDYVLNAPGTKLYSPVEMSKMAPFVDAATSVDPDNFSNIFTSYYPYGESVALALDLELRTRFDNLDLDDYMRAVWVKYGRQEIPHNNEDLKETLVELCGDKFFVNQFFQRHVYGIVEPDFPSLLANAGLVFHAAEDPSIGMEYLKFSREGITIASYAYMDGPIYMASLEKGDLITSINGKKISSKKKLQKLLSSAKVGDVWTVNYVRQGQPRSTEIKLQPSNQISVSSYEEEGLVVEPEMIQFRENWLGAKRVHFK